MEQIEVDKRKGYVYLDAVRYVSLDLLKQMIWGYLFVSVIVLTYTIYGKGTPWNIALIILTLAYIVGVLIFQRKNAAAGSFSLRFLVSGIVALFNSVYFLLLSYSFLALGDHPASIYIAILICYLVFLLLHNGLTVRSIRNGKYLKKKAVRKSAIAITTFASVGAVAGIGLSRTLRRHVDKSMYPVFGAVCCCIVSLLFLLGTVNLLKYYYCRKYSILCDEYGNTASELLIRYDRKKKKSTKILIGIVLTLIIIITVLVIIGVIIQN